MEELTVVPNSELETSQNARRAAEANLRSLQQENDRLQQIIVNLNGRNPDMYLVHYDAFFALLDAIVELRMGRNEIGNVVNGQAEHQIE